MFSMTALIRNVSGLELHGQFDILKRSNHQHPIIVYVLVID